jgi:hypothetical protein
LPAAVAVSVDIGMVLSLILSVLVEVALLKLVIVPEELKLTIPPVLFVIPAIVPDPCKLIVPVFVKLARAVEILAPLVIVIVPELVRVFIEVAVAGLLTFNMEALESVPDPARAVETDNVPLFVNVIPVTVTLGIDIVPERAWPLVLNVCTPVLAVKVPLFAIPPSKVGIAAADSVQVAPVLIVTKPIKVFVPVALLNFKVPLVPAPMVVVPLLFNVIVPKVKPAPSPIEIDPHVSVPVPVIVPVAEEVVFDTAPVTVSVTPVIVNVSVPVNDNDAKAFVGATDSVGWVALVGIITISPAAEPGLPLGVQFVVVAQAVVVPFQV